MAGPEALLGIAAGNLGATAGLSSNGRTVGMAATNSSRASTTSTGGRRLVCVELKFALSTTRAAVTGAEIGFAVTLGREIV